MKMTVRYYFELNNIKAINVSKTISRLKLLFISLIIEFAPVTP